MSDKPNTLCSTGEKCRLLDDLNDLKQEVQRLSELVNTDPLTNLFNYRHFCIVLEQEIERSRRSLQPTSLIMLDVDHFKSVNDQWGHEVGNQALELIARCIIQNIRKLDIACRYGGEEFAIILPSSDVLTSVRVAERIRQSIESTPLGIVDNNGQNHSITITASAGLSMYIGTRGNNSQTLIKAADEQLYQAKNQGRNRVCFTSNEQHDQQVSKEEKAALLTFFDGSQDRSE